MTWAVHEYGGSAGELHSLEAFGAAREVWLVSVDEPTLVLGSSQRDDSIDGAAAARHGIRVDRRRSGGGAVLLVPGEHRWFDVIVPVGDRLWDEDVQRAFAWLGSCIAAALGTDATVHTGPMEGRDLGRVVCFAGLGPGEVSVAGRKVVGLSQRRTRSAARFQCVVHSALDPELHGELVADPTLRPPIVERLTHAVGLVSDLDAAVASILAALPTD